jgi:hypothetical protein
MFFLFSPSQPSAVPHPAATPSHLPSPASPARPRPRRPQPRAPGPPPLGSISRDSRRARVPSHSASNSLPRRRTESPGRRRPWLSNQSPTDPWRHLGSHGAHCRLRAGRHHPGRCGRITRASTHRVPRLGAGTRYGAGLDHSAGHWPASSPRPRHAAPSHCASPGGGGGEVTTFQNASGLDPDTIAALHSQAAGVHNTRSLVSVVLDPTSSHYPRWRAQVVLTLRRFALADHVLDDPVAPLSPSWVQMDNVVISWLHDTITVELQDIIHDQSDTTCQAWLSLEDQFVGNREARALHLDTQFHLFSQGELSVDEYCRQMKGMADSLRDLGELVADRTLVLNLLRGLSPRYGHMKALIKRTVPFPTFHAVRNELLLEELTMTIEAPAPSLVMGLAQLCDILILPNPILGLGFPITPLGHP